jgi:HAD superfamily hydrolase (TIGR01662 family)
VRALAAGAPLTAVLFDYGNTLITFERPERTLHQAYARIAEVLRERGHQPPGGEELIRKVHDRVDAEFLAHQRSGALEEIDLVAAATRAYADLGMRLDPILLDELVRIEQEAWWAGIRLDPEAIPTLERLHTAGLRVGLCSNAPFRVASMHDQLAHLALREHLDAVTFSAEVGWRKPAPAMFAAALRALGAQPEESIMVGDSVREDVAGARGAGLRSILLVRDGQPPRDGVAEAWVRRLAQIPEALGLDGITTAEGAGTPHGPQAV